MPKPPILTPDERSRAIAIAAQSRKERAETKRQLSNGEISIFAVLSDPRPAIRKMRILELLESVPGIGKVRAKLIIDRNQISPTRRIMGLGKHQLAALGDEPALMKKSVSAGSLIVISGPGGVGKSTITTILRKDPRFWVSVSVTTREPRITERNGLDYFFITNSEFERMVKAGELLEWAEFAGAKYGTPWLPIQKWRNMGKNVVLEIEVAGARQVKAAEPSALLIFISPPSFEELAARLELRGTDTPERRAARLDLARAEMAAAPEFDHLLINNRVDELVEQLVSLATSNQSKLA
jgi:guanylate kinase